MREVIKKIGFFLLAVIQSILWFIFCGIPAGVLFLIHCIWVAPAFFRQLKSKKPEFLDSPLYGLIELLILLPLVLSSTP